MMVIEYYPESMQSSILTNLCFETQSSKIKISKYMVAVKILNYKIKDIKKPIC